MPQRPLWTFCVLLRNLLLAAVVYGVIFGSIELLSGPKVRVRGKLGIPAFLDKSGPADIVKTTKKGIKVKFATTSAQVNINPHANVFNRPESAVVPRDDYLGPRPHTDMEANLTMIVEQCRGTYNGLEKMRNVFECMQFLAGGEELYYALPNDTQRASAQSPMSAEYLNADGQNNTLQSYPTTKDARPYSKNDSGSCSGPIIPYHTYWTGPATWRVELFVKAYLHTQNLACSRLHIWLDADRSPNAVSNMLERDPLFARFLPFVDRGDIIIREWRFPQRIPIATNEEKVGYYKTPGKPNSKGEMAVADGIVQDPQGQEWLTLSPKQMTFLPQAVSDAVRFVILHLHGGAYFDMDVLMLRDMRPLLLPSNHSFAERWAAHSHPGDYNTAIMSLSANSSLSSYLLRGGVRMGLNFHPRVIGRMAWKDGRDQEFLMLETAAFDPIWTEFNWDREGRCTVPCLRDYSAVFKGKSGSFKDEWESYDGEQLKRLDLFNDTTKGMKLEMRSRSMRLPINITEFDLTQQPSSKSDAYRDSEKLSDKPSHSTEPEDSFSSSTDEEDALRKAGVVSDYRVEEDKFPPNNRTLENFFRGSWTYHIHNQWNKHPEPSSWLSVVEQAHNGFFAGKRTNMYGETWDGPELMPYNYWPEYV